MYTNNLPHAERDCTSIVTNLKLPRFLSTLSHGERRQGDDVFLVVPDEKDEDGNYPVRILSKKAMIEFVNQTE